MVEAAGVGLLVGVGNKQLIDSEGSLETLKTANTRISSTLRVHGIWQSSRVLFALPNRARRKRTEEQLSRPPANGAGQLVNF
jgi:hypothetical protein